MNPDNLTSGPDSLQFRPICKTDKFTLSSKFTIDNQQVILLLEIPNETQNIINIYEASIEAKSQIGQVLDNLNDLVDYLEECKNFKVKPEDGSIVLISRTWVKGKQKQIQLCKIQMKLKSVIKNLRESCNWVHSLEQIEEACKNPELSNTNITKFISTIARYLLKTKPDLQKQTQIQSPSSSIEPIINKIVQLGRQQEMIKDKIAFCNEQIKQVQAQIKTVTIEISEKCKVAQSSIGELGKMVEEIRVAELKKSDRIEKELEVGMVNMKGFINKVFGEIYEEIQLIKKGKYVCGIDDFKQMKQEQPFKTEYSFSSVLKHKSIKLLSSKSIQGIDNIRSKICLITPCINPAKRKGEQVEQRSIYLKIVNEASDILIGVCDSDKVRNLNYAIQSWGSGNHGGYYINSGGYLYSCYRKDYNDTLKSFAFKDGDVIQIVVSDAKKTVTFRNGTQNCQLQYDENVRPDRLHFCAVLHKNSSVVEIYP